MLVFCLIGSFVSSLVLLRRCSFASLLCACFFFVRWDVCQCICLLYVVVMLFVFCLLVVCCVCACCCPSLFEGLSACLFFV